MRLFDRRNSITMGFSRSPERSSGSVDPSVLLGVRSLAVDYTHSSGYSIG